MNVSALDHIVLNVVDVEQSLAWYVGILGLVPVRVEDWRQGKVPFPSVRVDPGTIIDLVAAERTGCNLDHLCLVVDRADVDAVEADTRFTIVDGPARRYGARGDGWSIYVLDPDDNVIELRTYDR